MEPHSLLEHAFVRQSLEAKKPEDLAPFFLKNWMHTKGALDEYTGAIDLVSAHGQHEDARALCCRALEIWPGMPALTRRYEQLNQQGAPEPYVISAKEAATRLLVVTRVLPDVSTFVGLKNIQLWLGECCNYRCWHCWYAQSSWKSGSARKFFVPLEVLKARLDNVEHVIRAVEAVSNYRYPRHELCVETIITGESMLYPHFPELVDAISEHGFSVSLNTNASLMSGKNLAALMRARVPAVSVSLDAFSADLYARFRKGGNLPRVLDNIHRFLDGAHRKTPRPKLVVNFCVTPHNAHELPDFVSYWENRADCIQIQQYAGNEIPPEKAACIPLAQRQPCTALQQSLQLAADGRVFSCTCGHAVLGTLDEYSLADLFLSEARIKLFAAHAAHDLEALPDVCRECSYWGAIQHSRTGQILINGHAAKCVRYSSSTCVYPRQATPDMPVWNMDGPDIFPAPPKGVERPL